METGLAFGSNTGDRLKYLRKAKQLVLAIPNVAFVAQSPVYETDPVDVPDEFARLAFLNCVLIIKICISAERLLVLLSAIEREMGRNQRSTQNMPRPIDIDIIYAGTMRINTRHTQIPHPRWFTRRFVLQPLSDIRAMLRVPGQSETVSHILASLNDTSKVTFFSDKW